MEIIWTTKALADLARLHQFLAAVNTEAAAQVVQSLIAAADNLLQFPRIGNKLPAFDSHELRRIIVGQYEMRYAIDGDTLYIVRIFHMREER